MVSASAFPGVPNNKTLEHRQCWLFPDSFLTPLRSGSWPVKGVGLLKGQRREEVRVLKARIGYVQTQEAVLSLQPLLNFFLLNFGIHPLKYTHFPCNF